MNKCLLNEYVNKFLLPQLKKKKSQRGNSPGCDLPEKNYTVA